MDYGYYKSAFGDSVKLPEALFPRFLELALLELSGVLTKIPEERDDNFNMCVLEIAELLYEESRRDGIKSEDNEGYRVSYEKRERAVLKIAKRRLLKTGLLYRGDICDR